MALNHSPRIVTDGLVFYYDMNNKKSYVGAPTTNLVSNADVMTGWTTYGGSPVAFQTEFGTTGYRLTNAPSWNGIYRTITLPSTGTYTFSVWIRYLGGSPNNNGGTVYISGWGGSDTSTAVNKNIIGQWQRVTRTLTVTNTTLTFYIISYGGTNDGNSDRSSWEITMPQVEAGSVATTFVNGTRSNAQSLIDLTNRNTITATSLTYATNNTFSFNGSSDYVDVANSLGTLTSYTVSFWARRDAENRMPFATRTGTTFYWYGDNSWRYTHGGVGGEYYYPKSVSIPLGTWGYYTVVYNGTNVAIYRQGVLEGTQATTGNADWSMGLRIGYWAGGTGYQWQGKIDAVSMYSRALTSEEVRQNFNAIRARYGV